MLDYILDYILNTWFKSFSFFNNFYILGSLIATFFLSLSLSLHICCGRFCIKGCFCVIYNFLLAQSQRSLFWVIFPEQVSAFSLDLGRFVLLFARLHATASNLGSHMPAPLELLSVSSLLSWSTYGDHKWRFSSSRSSLAIFYLFFFLLPIVVLMQGTPSHFQMF